jgi:hypothetical protein
VPVQDLKSSDEVLQAFANLVDDAKLKSIAEVLNYCFVRYYYLLENEPSNPFEHALERFKELRDAILKNYPILIQYFYDFIDDVLQAYYEFKHKVFEVSSSCCGNEMKFPLHLMLGEAHVSTVSQVRSNYREYFIYSPLFNNQKEKLAEVRLLFTRMKLLVREVDFISVSSGFDNRLVKVTPSRYGFIYLSDRCIPYHYKVADEGNELYRSWSYEKTKRGNERFNLGYNAWQYCSADNVVHPLLYDIERFNFFRVEGHIGKNITNAISLVKTIQQQNNLAFDVASLSADYIGALVRGEEPQCVIQDLESDYRVLIAEMICKMHDAVCFVSRLPYELPVNIASFNATSFAKVTFDDTSVLKRTLVFKPAIAVKTDRLLVSSLVNQFHAIKGYVKGRTLQKLCNPGNNTIGSAYIRMNGQFMNPVTITPNQPVTSVQYHAFEFIDATESILELVMNYELAKVDINELKTRKDRFEEEVKTLRLYAVAFLQYLETALKTEQSNLAELATDLYLDLLVFDLEMLLHLCFAAQVEALKSEYQRRMAQYRLAKNFSYYFKTHGGIEHKGGVPRGGTFILVYHEERRNRFIDKNSLFINQELSNLLLSHFSDLVKSDVSLDTLTYKTKLLQTAVLYKDPDLYMRFKDVLSRYLDDCTNLPDDKRKEITDIIDKEPRRPHFKLTDGMVIADFYIPYICCSDCPPVAYILPEKPEEPTEDPTIKVDKNVFCSDNNKPFPVSVTPKGGVVTGSSGVRVDNNGKYVFIPSAAPVGLNTLTYTVNGKTASLQVEVIAMPVAKFSPEIYVLDVGQTVIFDATSSENIISGVTVFKWIITGNSVPLENTGSEKISYTVQDKDEVLTVTLTLSNGDCSDSAEKLTIKVNHPSTSKPELKIEPGTICSKSDEKIHLHVSPPDDGIFKVDGQEKEIPFNSETQLYEFSRPGAEWKPYEFTYKAGNLLSDPQKLKVIETPVAKFSYVIKVMERRMTLTILNESNGISEESRYEWYKDREMDPFSEDPDPKPIVISRTKPVKTVTLKVFNGECSDTFKQEIELPGGTTTKIKIVECVVKEKLVLEPDNTAEVTGLVTDAVISDLIKVEVDLGATLSAGKEENHITYTLPDGNTKEVTLVVQSPNADFFMRITEQKNERNEVINAFLKLTAMNNNASSYIWEVSQTFRNKKTVVNSNEKEFTIDFKEKNFYPTRNTDIALKITNDNEQCNGEREYSITEKIYDSKKDKGPFDTSFHL